MNKDGKVNGKIKRIYYVECPHCSMMISEESHDRKSFRSFIVENGWARIHDDLWHCPRCVDYHREIENEQVQV